VRAHELARDGIALSLAQRCVLDDPALAVLGCVRLGMSTFALAKAILERDELLGDDLQKVATEASQWSEQLRASVPLLGAPRSVIQALFPMLTESPTHFPMVTLGKAELYFVFDAAGACVGVYAVGQREHRQLDEAPWAAEQILAQVFGKPTALVSPKKQAGDSSAWKREGVRIVARWRAGQVVELRIGEVDV
jgi:hypothetical protein